MNSETTAMKCAKCNDTGRVLTRMEAVHAPPAAMMMIKVYSRCPDGCAEPPSASAPREGQEGMEQKSPAVSAPREGREP